MRLYKIFAILLLTFLVNFNVEAQHKKYVGNWVLTKSKFSEKCAKDQIIELRADGTATYKYGTSVSGCKPQIQEFKTWNVEKKEFKMRKKNKNGKREEVKIKKTVLTIGKRDDIMFFIEKKKGKKMVVLTDVVSGDTTDDAMLTFTKR